MRLAGASPFSPVLKSLLADDEPAAAALRGRRALMHRVESRFRFLAVRCLPPALRTDAAGPEQQRAAQASTHSVIRGHRPSYRETLLAVRARLQVQCPGGLSLEARPLRCRRQLKRSCQATCCTAPCAAAARAFARLEGCSWEACKPQHCVPWSACGSPGALHPAPWLRACIGAGARRSALTCCSTTTAAVEGVVEAIEDEKACR